MATIQNFGAYLPNIELVKDAAASIGCVQTRGATKGQGSIRKFLYDVGAGEIFIGYSALDNPSDMRRAAQRLAQLAKAEDDTHVQELLTAFSKSLEKLADTKQSFEKESDDGR